MCEVTAIYKKQCIIFEIKNYVLNCTENELNIIKEIAK